MHEDSNLTEWLVSFGTALTITVRGMLLDGRGSVDALRCVNEVFHITFGLLASGSVATVAEAKDVVTSRGQENGCEAVVLAAIRILDAAQEPSMPPGETTDDL